MSRCCFRFFYLMQMSFFLKKILGCNVFVIWTFFQLLGHYFWIFPLNGKTAKRIFILPHRYVFHKQGAHLHKTSLHASVKTFLIKSDMYQVPPQKVESTFSAAED